MAAPQPDGLGPGQVRPMLATAGGLPGNDSGWAYEIKWDGVRSPAHVTGGRVRLFSRTGRELSASFPELQAAPAALRGVTAVLDGEIVAAPEGRPDFEALQHRLGVFSPRRAQQMASQIPVSYMAFDLLYADGIPLVGEPYHRRRALLDSLGVSGGAWETPPAFTSVPGAEVLAWSAAQHLEGIVAKREDSRYLLGRRSPGWRKIKNVRRQEAVVGGWTPGRDSSAGIGALVIGVYGPGGLDYAGQIGTGFTRQSRAGLREILLRLRRETPPFAGPLPSWLARAAVWAEPRLVIEVAFAGWTSAGRVRAASYKGLRFDKNPSDVHRESLAVPGQGAPATVPARGRNGTPRRPLGAFVPGLARRADALRPGTYRVVGPAGSASIAHDVCDSQLGRSMIGACVVLTWVRDASLRGSAALPGQRQQGRNWHHRPLPQSPGQPSIGRMTGGASARANGHFVLLSAFAIASDHLSICDQSA